MGKDIDLPVASCYAWDEVTGVVSCSERGRIMARTSNASKHPALQVHAQRGMQETEDRLKKGLLELDAYQRLTGEDQRFLAAYLQHRDLALAVKEQGRDLKWVHEKQRTVHGFQDVMDYVTKNAKEFALVYAEQMMAANLFELNDMIRDPDVDTANKIKAIKENRETVNSLSGDNIFAKGTPTMFNITIHGFDQPNDDKNIIDG